ncbi:ABC transporter permease [Hymenobacter sp. BT175]|uniref:ABC transporter permease n=1 Tax=Hymenobacter translucens TaxID=2886507 RepID=UPI001D0E7BC2|nr:ABC transporter permease [Hymenobacter translucens]MCC2546832.1 ABC transporter permease [Hymenobacter translucens]
MGIYLWRRVVVLVPTAWLVLSLIFLLSRGLGAAPPLPSLEADAIGLTDPTSQRRATEQRMRHRYGLDAPLFYITLERSYLNPNAARRWQWHGTANQYHSWVKQLSRGDFGFSYRDSKPVTSVLLDSLRHTLPLTVGAAVLATTLALALGVFTRPRWQAALRSILSLLDILPLFVVALLLLLLLANPDVLAWFPAYGEGRIATEAVWWQQLGTYLYYLALPLACLVLVTTPGLALQLDAALQHELGQAYATTARAKGLSTSRVQQKHALRNAWLPFLTVLAELLPALVAGTVVVETVFARPGMGRALAEAAAARDFPVLLAGVLLLATIRLAAYILTDWLYQLADPRLRPAS